MTDVTKDFSSEIAHVADSTDATLIPYDWYRDLVLEGAFPHGIPDCYMREYIQSVHVEDTSQQLSPSDFADF